MAWPCENDPDPQGLPPKPLNRDLSLGLSCASSCFLISVASVSTSKARFHHKGCLFFIQGRNVFISVIRTISSVNCNQTQFWFKTKEKKPKQNKKNPKKQKPQLWEIWHWPNFLWKIPKWKTLAKGRERKQKGQCLYIHRDREYSSPLRTFALAWTGWLGRFTLLKHKPDKWV